MQLPVYGANDRQAEKGNVLFLILIAVALFAALSYAVMSSTRSGTGSSSQETNLISSAQITQYPASVRTAIVRMIISNNVSAEEIRFNPPEQFGDADFAGQEPRGVFHPSGGGAAYSTAPKEVVTTTTAQSWIFNGENEINFIGTSVGGDNPTDDSADIIAFLPNLTDAICKKINEQLGIGTTIPTESNIDVTTEMENSTGINSTSGGGGTIGDDVATLDGQAFGCFNQGGINYYYHVLVER